MPEPRLEEVFKLSGVPTYTFVRPQEYTKLAVALRTPGRGIVIEGPSGIGKTTAVTRALEEQGFAAQAMKLTARKQEDRDLIKELPGMVDTGLVIIDDFHKLDMDVQRSIADFLKVLADEERASTKIVIVGINKAGDTLVSFAPDLNNRIDTIRFESNTDDRVEELVRKGENALNVDLGIGPQIVRAASGSFYIAQMLCRETCLIANVTERLESKRIIQVSSEAVNSRVIDDLSRRFMKITTDFAAGPKLRREGRAPYLHILKWLSEANDWSLQLDREIARHAEQRGSVGQVVDKGYLETFIAKHEEFRDVLHFVPQTQILTVNDPQFVYFLRNLGWKKFAERVGFVSVELESKYDFALSFAGPDRNVAKRLFEILSEYEFQVFYDENEQHRIMAEAVEEYLAPIYRSEATYVVCLLGPEYPKRIWTKFESDQFKERFGQKSVIPIWFANAPPGMFDETNGVGGAMFDPTADQEAQLVAIADQLRRKLAESKVLKAGAEPEGQSQ